MLFLESTTAATSTTDPLFAIRRSTGLGTSSVSLGLMASDLKICVEVRVVWFQVVFFFLGLGFEG